MARFKISDLTYSSIFLHIFFWDLLTKNLFPQMRRLIPEFYDDLPVYCIKIMFKVSGRLQKRFFDFFEIFSCYQFFIVTFTLKLWKKNIKILENYPEVIFLRGNSQNYVKHWHLRKTWELINKTIYWHFVNCTVNRINFSRT